MGKALQLFKNRNLYAVALSVVLSVVLVAVAVSGATTISTNISTGGTLAVTGASTLTGAIYASSTAIVTGQIRVYNQLVLNSAAADPTGDAAGALYFDSVEKRLRLYNGVGWQTVASSSDANGGLTLADSGVRFNTVATGYMALGTSTLPIATSTLSNSVLLHLNATTTATVPLQITGVIGQTGDLMRLFRTTAAAGHLEVFAIDSVGGASTTVLTTTRRAADALVVSGYATTSGFTGNFATEGTLGVIGATTLTGALNANGNVTLGNALADAIVITGAASTTNSLNVGGVFSVGAISTTTVNVADGVATTTIGISAGNVLGIGTTTPGHSGGRAAALGVNGNAYIGGAGGTTTIAIESTTGTRGGCIQIESTAGTIHRVYIGVAATLIVETGACDRGGAGN